MLRHIIVKYLKTKGEDEILKATRENSALTSEKQFDDNGFLIWNYGNNKKMAQISFKCCKKKKKDYHPRILYLMRTNFVNKEVMETFSYKGKVRDFVTNRFVLKR